MYLENTRYLVQVKEYNVRHNFIKYNNGKLR